MGKPIEASEELILHLVARGRKVHKPSTREVVEGPESCDREHRTCLPREVGARRGGLITGFVV
jgi:hypothetical protein